jgi:putative oxidoreductase
MCKRRTQAGRLRSFSVSAGTNRLFASRRDGTPGVVIAVLRVAVGMFFVSVSTGKFFDHAAEAVDFDRYGVPMPDVAVSAVGVVELVGGILLIVGLCTRPAAAVLAATMVGAIATAGRVDGGSFHLGVAPTALVLLLVLVWLGSGSFAIDARLDQTGSHAPDR